MKTDQQLRGLGGWLILLAIGLLGMPVHLSMHVEQAQRQFAAPAIQAYTTSDPRWQTLAFIETSGHSIAIFPAIILIFLFFFKHRSFPLVFSALACFRALLTFARFYFVFSTPTISQDYRSAIIAPSIISLLGSAVWVAYIFRSRRVLLTFTRRFYFTPFFPFVTTA